MRLIRIFTIAIFMCIAGFAALPAQEAQAAPVAASSLGEQVSPASLAPTRVWYYYRRHYWHRHYWHRHYWHRHYWHRHYWHRHYYHRRYYRRYYW